MRKIILALFVCLLAGGSFGQRISNDSLFIDTLVFVKGQNITLGEGSNMATKEFNFITSAPGAFIPKSKLPSNWNGLQMTVKGFKYFHSKRGEKYYLILGGGNIVNYWCDIVPAIKNKEISF
jgi:hypothetical protein